MYVVLVLKPLGVALLWLFLFTYERELGALLFILRFLLTLVAVFLLCGWSIVCAVTVLSLLRRVLNCLWDCGSCFVGKSSEFIKGSVGISILLRRNLFLISSWVCLK